jgi:hypothetical protein
VCCGVVCCDRLSFLGKLVCCWCVVEEKRFKGTCGVCGVCLWRQRKREKRAVSLLLK